MDREYSAFDLARYILKKCIDDENVISNLQLQKILYCIQECFLREKGHEAFSEPIEAWQFGPVVPEVYDEYRIYGGRTIVWMPDAHDNVAWKDEKDKKLIDNIVEEKRKLDPWDMVQETHKEGGAWAKIYDDGRGAYKVIPIETIKKYLQKQQKSTVNKSKVRFVLQKIKELFSV